MTRSSLVRLVWASLPEERRVVEAGVRCVVIDAPGKRRVEDIEGLTEAELLGLLPDEMRQVITAQLNGEEPMAPGLRKAGSQPGPGPRKATGEAPVEKKKAARD